ncbi:methionine--tRNA ligase subunit beta [Candidatus Nomurabacteria bacterium RIFCSPLOWO2_02_FULL_40_10]|uniref:Methionine--tRNA ligase n=1 Tax=Candidatus Nomurabacteria bacterium RIFCSPLOWO2_02_FULL_40_10 TaxID=1801786 RepID=A0A1F6XWX2_9BACT|nr:MAG: methionine--tRNA ligase subunit beta [Candidatus Nomurabacteria bacterium RIFCSPLOWO2_02_FULL_40_10]
MLSFEDFQNVDLRVGKVVSAERVEGSEKLLKLQVDLGAEFGERQIIAGVGKVYEPDSLVGKEIIIVTNLEPRSLMGLESQGMLLAADSESGPILLIPDKDAKPGSKVK